METRAGGHALHNMSAMPRMQITLRPHVASPAQESARAGQGEGSPEKPVINGLRFTGSGSLAECIGRGRRHSRRASRRPERAAGDPSPAAFRAGSFSARDLCPLLGERRPRSLEAAGDRVLERLAGIDPRTLGLPGFALAVRLEAGRVLPHAAGPPLSPLQLLVLLSRTAGGVFLAARRPRLALEEWVEGRYAWYFPVQE